MSSTLRHEMLEIPFQTEHGLAWIIVPREGLTPEDAQRMAEMVKTTVLEPRGAS